MPLMKEKYQNNLYQIYIILIKRFFVISKLFEKFFTVYIFSDFALGSLSHGLIQLRILGQAGIKIVYF